MAALSPDAEQVLGAANEQLAGCGPSDVVLAEFLPPIDRGDDANRPALSHTAQALPWQSYRPWPRPDCHNPPAA